MCDGEVDCREGDDEVGCGEYGGCVSHVTCKVGVAVMLPAWWVCQSCDLHGGRVSHVTCMMGVAVM